MVNRSSAGDSATSGAGVALGAPAAAGLSLVWSNIGSLSCRPAPTAGPAAPRRPPRGPAGLRRQRARNVMMPRTGSYGETPTVTRSPGTTLMR